MTDAQFAIIATLLTEIRDALLAPMPNDDEPCGHPDDARIDRSTFTRVRWTCRACGHDEDYNRATTLTS